MMLGLSSGAAFADGIEIPAKVKPTAGGNVVLRATLTTTENITGLERGVFSINKEGKVGDQIEATLRPERMNTTAGRKTRQIVQMNKPEENTVYAFCMWKSVPAPKPTAPQLLSAFRVCKLFEVTP